jgi:nucleotide-binding universal stress UspA family protein
MKFFERIMIAVRPAHEDDLLLAGAAGLVAALAPSEVHVVCVEPVRLPWPGGTDADAVISARLEADARGALHPSPATRLVARVERGQAIDILLRHAVEERIDLLLVGHRRGRRATALARRLARSAPCAVWMVPDGAFVTPDRILVSVDYSETSGLAVDAALDLCRALGLSECGLVNVHYDGDDDRANDGSVTQTEDAEYEAFIRRRRTDGVVVRRQPENAIDVASGLEHAVRRHGADLVVMGSRGRSTAVAVLLGSATEDAMDRLGCGVLVIRAQGPVPSFAETLVRRIFTEDDRPRFG